MKREQYYKDWHEYIPKLPIYTGRVLQFSGRCIDRVMVSVDYKPTDTIFYCVIRFFMFHIEANGGAELVNC